MKYVIEYRDRHGRLRRYFRYRGKCTAMPDEPGKPGFDAHYLQLLIENGLTWSRAQPARPRNGFVYFARCNDLIKIGFSTQPKERLTQLQSGSGAPIEIVYMLPASTEYERWLHKQFASYRVSGEWFAAAPDVLHHIETVRHRGRVSMDNGGQVNV